MKKLICRIGCLMMVAAFVYPVEVFARPGDCGYEGGISSGEAPGKTSYEYREVCFISGEPIVFSGTMTLKKSLKSDSATKNDVVTSLYTYNLKNTEKSSTLTRTVILSTILTKKENKQTIEDTTLSGKTSEVVKIKNTTYTLKSYDFTRTNLIDSRPAVDYFSGNLWGRKIYEHGTATDGGTVTVDVTGNFYGYNEYWGTTETQDLNYMIESQKNGSGKVDKWGGNASVNISASTTKQLKFVENKPEVISFDGGYVQSQYNQCILEYRSSLPRFDSNGISTDTIVEKSDSVKIESFPSNTRLPVPNVNHLRGHWAENDIKVLYSLEVFKSNDSVFNPERYMTRAEFANAIVNAAKEVPVDPQLQSRMINRTSSSLKQKLESPFTDVSTDHLFFNVINSAFKRGLINGTGNSSFAPGEYLNAADAVTMMITALGLEGLAKGPGTVTSFKDNDAIPGYAKKSVYVAEKIGLIQGDGKGYFKPKDKLTNSRASAIINKFIDYMREGIRKDYKERIINY